MLRAVSRDIHNITFVCNKDKRTAAYNHHAQYCMLRVEPYIMTLHCLCFVSYVILQAYILLEECFRRTKMNGTTIICLSQYQFCARKRCAQCIPGTICI